MKIRIAVLSAAILLACAGVAKADQTKQFNGVNCSITAHNVFEQGLFIDGNFGESCGGSDVHLQKSFLTINLLDLVTGGWETTAGEDCSSQSGTQNPISGSCVGGNGFNMACVPGRWYADQGYGEIVTSHGDFEQEADTKGSGFQCPA